METNYVVLKPRDYNGDYKYAIISKKSIETIDLCETRDGYGNKIGCYDAGCYVWEDSSGIFRDDLKAYIEKEFSIWIKTNIHSCDNVDEFFKEIEEEVEKKHYNKIKKSILNWIDDNQHHTVCNSYEYTDSANCHSIVLSDEYIGNDECYAYEILDEDDFEAEEILNELPDYPYIDGINKTIETDNHSYFYSRYSYFPFICKVD